MGQFDDDFIPPVTSINHKLEQEVLSDLVCLTLQIVNVVFVGHTHKNGEFVLVDTGMPETADHIFNTAEHRFGNRPPQAIILTHGHFDHVGAIDELLQKWDVPVYAHERELPYLTGQDNYPEGDWTAEGGLVPKLSPLFPNHGIDLGERVQPLPADGSVPGLPDFRWLHTPGHTPGHVSLFRQHDRTLIAGDAFVTVNQASLYSVYLQKVELNGPPPYFTIDWASARTSLEKLASLQPEVAVTGHGMPVKGDTFRKQLGQLAAQFEENAIKK